MRKKGNYIFVVFVINTLFPSCVQYVCRAHMERTAHGAAAALRARHATMSPESVVVLLDSWEMAANRVSTTGTSRKPAVVKSTH